MPKSKPRIYWTDSAGKKRDIPDKAPVTLVSERGSVLKAWIKGDRICMNWKEGPDIAWEECREDDSC